MRGQVIVSKHVPIIQPYWTHEPYGDPTDCWGCGLEPDDSKEWAYGLGIRTTYYCQWCLGLLAAHYRHEGRRTHQQGYAEMCLRSMYGHMLRKWGWL